MKGVIHHAVRIWKSPLFIVVVTFLALITVGMAISGLFLGNGNVQNSFVYGVVKYHGEVFFDSYSENSAESPLQGANVSVVLSNSFSLPTKYFNLSTNNTGFANVTLGSISALSEYRLYASLQNGDKIGQKWYPIGASMIPIVAASNSSYGLITVRENKTSFYSDPLVICFNQSGNGSLPVNVFVTTTYFGPTGTGAVTNSTIEMGPFSGFTTVKVPGEFGNYSVEYGVVSVNTVANNTTVASGFLTLYSLPPGYGPEVSFIGLLPVSMGLLVVLLGLYSVEITYGKDETSGALEAALSKGIKRSDLLLQRYVASALTVILVVGGITGATCAIFFGVTGKVLPIGFVVSLFFGVSIPTLSIMAFPFMLGRFRRIREIIGVLMWIVMIIVAGLVLVAVTIFTPSSHVPYYLSWLPLLSSINYYSLILNAFYPGLASFSGFNLLPAGTFPAPELVIIGGILWVLLPALFFYRSADREY